jgi:hypothetical protein
VNAAGAAFIVLQFCQRGITLSLDPYQFNSILACEHAAVREAREIVTLLLHDQNIIMRFAFALRAMGANDICSSLPLLTEHHRSFFGFSQLRRLSHLKILQPVMPMHLVTQFRLQGLDGIGGLLHQIAQALSGGIFRHPVTAGALATTGFLVTAESQGFNQFTCFHWFLLRTISP